MELRDRATDFVKALPVAHRVGIVAAIAVTAMAGVGFVSWLTTPSYTVLYSGLDEESVATAVDELETLGVPYRLEQGGSTIMVPREQLYATRAEMAAAGQGGGAVPEGYDLMDSQGLSVSDFRQRIDYQRALEGELSKTLMAMDGIDQAQVRLVMPEQELFAEEAEPATASVLLTPNRDLDEGEIETVSFLVASSVPGLDVDAITVADAEGTVLHAPGEIGGASVATNRNLRQTREFEQALAEDVRALLARSGGGPADVVVRATLDFDESETSQETFNPDRQVTLTEQTSTETFAGIGPPPDAGAVGIDGGPIAGEGAESDYRKDDVLREFGVDRTTVRTIAAPGAVQRLSVAVVTDDGTVTGATALPPGEVERLVNAAIGLDPARGDTIAVTAVPFEEVEEDVEPEVEEDAGLAEALSRYVGAGVVGLAALVLLAMTRRRKPKPSKELELASGPVVIDVTATPYDRDPVAEPTMDSEPQRLEPALVGASVLRDEVTELVARQPEEIATLLRSWLADRRV